VSHLANEPISCGTASLGFDEHLTEVAEIMAAGLTRLIGLKSSPISAGSGESSVGFGPQPSGDAPTLSIEVDA
jgi:hypothetical protein